MLLRRRLEPKPFHALYFPERKPENRDVIIGTAVGPQGNPQTTW